MEESKPDLVATRTEYQVALQKLAQLETQLVNRLEITRVEARQVQGAIAVLNELIDGTPFLRKSVEAPNDAPA